MIFDALLEAREAGELLLIDGGMCRWHLRKDHCLTIYEILSTRPGAGSEMLRKLQAVPAKEIRVRCPADLPALAWWRRKGFEVTGHTRSPSGRVSISLVWRSS